MAHSKQNVSLLVFVDLERERERDRQTDRQTDRQMAKRQEIITYNVCPFSLKPINFQVINQNSIISNKNGHKVYMIVFPNSLYLATSRNVSPSRLITEKVRTRDLLLLVAVAVAVSPTAALLFEPDPCPNDVHCTCPGFSVMCNDRDIAQVPDFTVTWVR